MIDSNKILEMIENVSPDDTATLDEIDARVYAFLELQGDFQMSYSGNSIYYRHNDSKEEDRTILLHLFDRFQYTRSRDALKAIRPEGWFFDIYWSADVCTCTGEHSASNCYIDNSVIATSENEELAELHAIIQAIQWSRENDNNK